MGASLKRTFLFLLFILLIPISIFSISNIAVLTWDYGDTSNISAFRVYFSEISQSYNPTNVVEVSKSFRRASVKELRFSTRYFFVATAIDNYGNESERSEEISYIVPTLAPQNLKIATVYTSPNGDSVTIQAIITGVITNTPR